MIKFDADRVDQILEAMNEVKIAVVGDLMLDRYMWGEAHRISPEAPVPIVTMEGESSNLGGAANVAANVGSLGADVTLFGVVGDDPTGRELRNLVVQSSFNDDGIITDSSRPTSSKTRVIAHSQHIVRIDRESTDKIGEELERKLLDRFQSVLNDIDAVILQDYNKGLLTPAIIQGIIAECRRVGVPVGVDPKWDNFWEFGGVTVFKPNVSELVAAAGHSISNEDELKRAGRSVIKRIEAEYLLVTRGKEGMALFSDGEMELIPTQAHRVHDVSGAGDTVIATVMTALAGGADITDAALMGNFAASVVIAELGAVPVDPDKLRRSCLER
ncbi:MAG: D-glycero-beta-D-manno-heptose-7-phosphate kinase [Candidatus Electryoneaceae bacterium]|nr:D-glycero-beta-D-manno-heptose-7-phosphate kinase [Candidatus Electryoneaceae bacterium]